MAKLNVKSLFGRKFRDLMLAITAGAAWIFLVDRGAALLSSADGEQSLTIGAGIAMFGWAAVVLVTASGIAAVLELLSTALSRSLSLPSLSPYFFGALLGAVAAVPFYIVGKDFASGDWISHQSFAFAVHAVPAVFGPLGVAFLGCLFFRFDAESDPRPWRRRIITLLFFLVSCGCSAAGLHVLFDAYPNFQVLLYVLSLSSFLAAAYRIVHLLTRRRSERVMHVLAASAFLLIAVSAVTAVSMNRKTRSELAVKSTTMAQLARKTGRFFSESLLQNTLRTIQTMSASSNRETALQRGMIKIGDDWNVLFMVVDCLRSDALLPNRKKGREHAKDGDTPFLDKLISDSFTFRYAYAQGSRTLMSMPVMFRSLEPFDRPGKEGIALGTYVKSLGRTPVAVVNDVFMRPWRTQFQNLLSGFEYVSIFEEKEIDTEVNRALEIFKDEEVRPFFAWLHFQSVHAPYFDGRLLSDKDGSPPKRYRRGLKWLDRQIRELFSGLDKMGVLDKTIIILASDHGEDLGDNNDKFTVFEEAIHVPLAIKIPGRKGRIINQTVGNIDIVPTIADLLGAPLNPSHRGRSLVPLMKNPKLKWRRTYYTRNASGEMFSVVRGRDKLIYDVDAEAIYRFDLKTDPTEDNNLYSPSGKLDQELLLSALTTNPARFADELQNKETKQLLEETILGIDPKHPGGELGFLVSLAAFDPSRKVEAHLLKVFNMTADDNSRLLVLRGMFESNSKLWTSALVKYLKKIGGKKKELDYIGRLAVQGQAGFSHRFVAGRLKWWMKQSIPEALDPWLRLIFNWPKKSESIYGELLTDLLERMYADKDKNIFSSEQLALVLENIYSTNWKPGSATLVRARGIVHALFEYPDSNVQRSVYKALGRIGDRESATLLTAKLESIEQPVRIRQSALHAIVDIQRDEAIPLILKYCTEPKLQSDAIVLLKKLGNPKGIPMLRQIAQNHPKRTFRGAARKAINHILKKKI